MQVVCISPGSGWIYDYGRGVDGGRRNPRDLLVLLRSTRQLFSYDAPFPVLGGESSEVYRPVVILFAIHGQVSQSFGWECFTSTMRSSVIMDFSESWTLGYTVSGG